MNYYNELDPYAAQWLRNLIAKNLIPNGKVDTRDIRKVKAKEVRDYTQAHFFAGIAGWSYALQLAGWPEDEEVWTGSCPCQPFSIAGKGKGKKDKRHLWPVWKKLIAECRPPVLFGEQVASPLGRDWLAGVWVDLETLGYEVGAADLCAAGVGAPHIRQRLFWVGVANRAGSQSRRKAGEALGYGGSAQSASRSCRLGYAACDDKFRYSKSTMHREGKSTGGPSRTSRLVNAESRRTMSAEQQGSLPGHQQASSGNHELGDTGSRKLARRKGKAAWEERSTVAGASPVDESFWGDYELVHCADGKARRIESGTFPLAFGVPARVGKLRAYGNAIVAHLAAEFIMAYLETRRSKDELHQAHRSAGGSSVP